ncbi:MAG: NifU family protein [Candidatus Kapaibacterium sp.]
MEKNEELYKNIETLIDNEIRPFIEADGGRIKLRDIKDNTVYVELAGACAGCPGAAMTLRGGVERIIKMNIPEIKSVELAL